MVSLCIANWSWWATFHVKLLHKLAGFWLRCSATFGFLNVKMLLLSHHSLCESLIGSLNFDKKLNQLWFQHLTCKNHELWSRDLELNLLFGFWDELNVAENQFVFLHCIWIGRGVSNTIVFDNCKKVSTHHWMTCVFLLKHFAAETACICEISFAKEHAMLCNFATMQMFWEVFALSVNRGVFTKCFHREKHWNALAFWNKRKAEHEIVCMWNWALSSVFSTFCTSVNNAIAATNRSDCSHCILSGRALACPHCILAFWFVRRGAIDLDSIDRNVHWCQGCELGDQGNFSGICKTFLSETTNHPLSSKCVSHWIGWVVDRRTCFDCFCHIFGSAEPILVSLCWQWHLSLFSLLDWQHGHSDCGPSFLFCCEVLERGKDQKHDWHGIFFCFTTARRPRDTLRTTHRSTNNLNDRAKKIVSCFNCLVACLFWRRLGLLDSGNIRSLLLVDSPTTKTKNRRWTQ